MSEPSSDDVAPKPRRGRFQPGQSGNPSGTSGYRRRSAAERELERVVTVQVDGRPVKTSVQKAMLMALGDRAARGDPVAGRDLRKAALDGAKTRAAQLAAVEAAQRLEEAARPVPQARFVYGLSAEQVLERLGGWVDFGNCGSVRGWVVEAALAHRRELQWELDEQQWSHIRDQIHPDDVEGVCERTRLPRRFAWEHAEPVQVATSCAGIQPSAAPEADRLDGE